MTANVHCIIYTNISIDSCKLHTKYDIEVKVLATMAKSKQIRFSQMGILLAFGQVANIR